jgi:hypothetical protein
MPACRRRICPPTHRTGRPHRRLHWWLDQAGRAERGPAPAGTPGASAWRSCTGDRPVRAKAADRGIEVEFAAADAFQLELA